MSFGSISWDTIPKDLIVPNGIAFLLTGIAGVAFNGIDHSVFRSCNNAYVVGLTVPARVIVPIEEDDHTRRGFCGVVGPLASLLEPADTAPKEDAPAPMEKKAPSGDLFSSLFSTGSDGILIAGLLYLLYREKSDNLLMLALLYILL